MAVAYWFIRFRFGLQMPDGIFPVVNGGDLAILFCFVFLAICVAEAEIFSIDRLRLASPDADPSYQRNETTTGE